MEKFLTIKHRARNQYYFMDCIFYDVQLIVYASSLVKHIKSKFGVDIPLNEDVEKKAEYYRGKAEYGNILAPIEMFIKETWGDKWELLTRYDLESCKNCLSTYGNFEKGDIISIAKALADFVNNNDVLSDSFYRLISDSVMSVVCDAYDCAIDIIRYYKNFVNIEKGVNEFLNIANPRYPLNTSKLLSDLLDEIKSYGLIK